MVTHHCHSTTIHSLWAKHHKGKLLVHERYYRYHLRTLNSGPTPTPALFPRCTYSRKKPTRALQCIQSRVNLGPFTVLWIRFLCFLAHSLCARSLTALTGCCFTSSFLWLTLLSSLKLWLLHSCFFLGHYFLKPFWLSQRTLSSLWQLIWKSNK